MERKPSGNFYHPYINLNNELWSSFQFQPIKVVFLPIAKPQKKRLLYFPQADYYKKIPLHLEKISVAYYWTKLFLLVQEYKNHHFINFDFTGVLSVIISYIRFTYLNGQYT